jgi:hypothetical protein
MMNDILSLVFIIIIVTYLFMLYQKSTYRQSQYDEKLDSIKRMVFISKNISNPSLNPNDIVDPIKRRDMAVTEDPLYPPLGRMPRPTADQYLKYKQDGILGVSTRGSPDTFRLMAYMINSVDRAEKWNVYGRQKYRGSSQGDFYAIQQCNSTSQCTKIDLNNDMIANNQLRDYYNLPSTITFSSPLFSKDPYDIVQLKTTVDYGPYH